MTIPTISDYLLIATYGSQGIVISLANGLLLVAILHSLSLRKRKEMVIIAGMAAVDVFYGLSTVSIALYRLYIYAKGWHDDKITAWDCVIVPPYFLIFIGTQLTAVVNIAVSCDRFIAVAWPLKYRILNRIYAVKVLTIVGLFGIGSGAAMLVSTYFDTSPIPNMTKLCSIAVFSFSYNLYHQTLTCGAGFVSVAIYVGVFFIYRRSISHLTPNGTISDQRAVALQNRLTVTLGIITLSTLIFFIIPFSINAVYAWMNIKLQFSVVTGTISRFSTIINVVIYVYRQKEMRREIRALFTCKNTIKPSVHTIRSTAAAHSRQHNNSK